MKLFTTKSIETVTYCQEYFDFSLPNGFPRCMECQRGPAMRKMSVRPSVTRMHCDKTEKDLSRFLYDRPTTDPIAYFFLRSRIVGGGTPST